MKAASEIDLRETVTFSEFGENKTKDKDLLDFSILTKGQTKPTIFRATNAVEKRAWINCLRVFDGVANRPTLPPIPPIALPDCYRAGFHTCLDALAATGVCYSRPGPAQLRYRRRLLRSGFFVQSSFCPLLLSTLCVAKIWLQVSAKRAFFDYQVGVTLRKRYFFDFCRVFHSPLTDLLARCLH